MPSDRDIGRTNDGETTPGNRGLARGMRVSIFAAIEPAFVFSGFCVGLLVGMTGVGGGSLMTPLLVLLFGVHPATAVGTDLLFAAATKGVGMAVHGFNRTVDWSVTALLALGSIPATAATLWLLSQVQASTGGGTKLISLVLGLALIVTSATLIFRRFLRRLVETRHLAEEGREDRRGLATVVLGAVLGVVVSISSVGAGAIGMTALLMLYPRRPIARLIGSDIAHAVPLTLIAGLGHWMIGSVDLALLGALLVGSVPGVIIGSAFGPRLPEPALRTVLAVVLALVGAKLVFG